MTRTSQIVCAFYAAVTVAALYGTWSQNLAYFGPGAPATGFLASFLLDLSVNSASRSITIDIGFLFLAVATLMVAEARRLGVRFVWAYILLGLVIAASVTVPLFLIAREWRMTSNAPIAKASTTIMTLDVLGLAAMTALTLYLSIPLMR